MFCKARLKCCSHVLLATEPTSEMLDVGCDRLSLRKAGHATPPSVTLSDQSHAAFHLDRHHPSRILRAWLIFAVSTVTYGSLAAIDSRLSYVATHVRKVEHFVMVCFHVNDSLDKFRRIELPSENCLVTKKIHACGQTAGIL